MQVVVYSLITYREEPDAVEGRLLAHGAFPQDVLRHRVRINNLQVRVSLDTLLCDEWMGTHLTGPCWETAQFREDDIANLIGGLLLCL